MNDKRKNYFYSGINDTNEEFSRILSSLFKDYNNENDKTKFIYKEEIPFLEEYEFKKMKKYLKEYYELSNYFKYDSNPEIKSKFIELKFIKEEKEKSTNSDDDMDDPSNIKEKIPPDESLIKLY